MASESAVPAYMRASARVILSAVGGETVTIWPRGVAAHAKAVTAVVRRRQDTDRERSRVRIWELHVEDDVDRGIVTVDEADVWKVPVRHGSTEVQTMRFRRLVKRNGNGIIVLEVAT